MEKTEQDTLQIHFMILPVSKLILTAPQTENSLCLNGYLDYTEQSLSNTLPHKIHVLGCFHSVLNQPDRELPDGKNSHRLLKLR